MRLINSKSSTDTKQRLGWMESAKYKEEERKELRRWKKIRFTVCFQLTEYSSSLVVVQSCGSATISRILETRNGIRRRINVLARRWKESLRHQRDSFTIFSRPTCIQLPFRFYDLPLAHGLPFFFLLFATLQPTDSGFPSGRWERQVEDHAHRRILFRRCRDSFALLCLDELVALAMSSYRCDIGQGIIPTRYVSLEFITTKLVMLLTTVLSKFLYYTYTCFLHVRSRFTCFNLYRNNWR